jgi:hypothetical protein
VLSIIGGLLGVAAGLALAYALTHLTDQRTVVSYPTAALALGISALVGILAVEVHDPHQASCRRRYRRSRTCRAQASPWRCLLTPPEANDASWPQ